MNQITQEDVVRAVSKGGDGLMKVIEATNGDAILNITNHLSEIVNYQPRVGVFGKTGAGKSSLCNALFGSDVCKIDDVKGCTRKTEDVLLKMGAGHSITLADVPGVGESGKRDEEYGRLYEKLLPKLDAVLWLVKADDRANETDERFFNNIVKKHVRAGMPFFFVVTQVEKMEPFGTWNFETSTPGSKQAKNIDEKIHYIAKTFGVAPNKVISISANEEYNLAYLVESLVLSLPENKRAPLLARVNKRIRTERAVVAAKEGLENSVKRTLQGALKGMVVISPIRNPIATAVAALVGAVAGYFKLW